MPTKRKHIPALDPAKLTLALQQLEALKVSKAAKQQIADMLQAAANPDSEHPTVVMATLPGERKHNVQQTAQALKQVTSSVTRRGKQALIEMSDEEWQKLVDEANKK